MIMIYITAPNKKAAEKITKTLLEHRLVACANLFPAQSWYWWEEKITASREWIILAKTKTVHWAPIRRIIEKIHPYQTPCILKINAQANNAFKKWVLQNT